MTLEEYRENLPLYDRQLFDEVVDIGIKKTIYALLDANVPDQTIMRVVINHWEIPQEKFTNVLIKAKKDAALYYVRQHLLLQGYNADEVDEFLSSHMIGIHLLHNHELLNQWRSPEKIIKAVQQKKKSKEK